LCRSHAAAPEYLSIHKTGLSSADPEPAEAAFVGDFGVALLGVLVIGGATSGHRRRDAARARGRVTEVLLPRWMDQPDVHLAVSEHRRNVDLAEGPVTTPSHLACRTVDVVYDHYSRPLGSPLFV
jgi:hypothetical protein